MGRDMKPSIVVVLRGVAPSSWDGCRRVLAAVREVGPLPVTLLCVPRLHGQSHSPRLDQQLGERLQQGDELALHGYMHEEDGPPRGLLDALRRRCTGAKAEFRSLRCDDALQRLHAGMRWFAANGWPLGGFAAPRWELGPGAWAALKLTSLRYALCADSAMLLPQDEELPMHRVEHRCEGALARHRSMLWHALPGRLGQEAAPVLRLDLTPESARHAAVRRAWQACLWRHLAWRQPVTVGRAVRLWEPALAGSAPSAEPRPSVRA